MIFFAILDYVIFVINQRLFQIVET